MLRTPENYILIDMPGVREVQLYDDRDALDMTFDDIAELAKSCKFNDCKHENEPGCAVLEAIEEGDMAYDRLVNYKKMLREMDAYWKRKGKGKYKSSRKRA
ncbi:Ribosome biogenesis GTPase RsgA like protein [Aduncisulcus paluster]|uniref:Ribosome biogenesis GTPase RsgA like protein n=1 Tax=Aduncisulcus paluster TaxID=2918883 RepID=A0ABQ5KKQ8_9EUKA|nr:Ribosome biogenesis GTPase RsgA like protein [Aduncisulcus paluster]